MFGSVESEYPRLTNGEIISEEFQHMRSQFTNITDGRSDRRTDGRPRGKNCMSRDVTFAAISRTTNYAVHTPHCIEKIMPVMCSM